MITWRQQCVTAAAILISVAMASSSCGSQSLESRTLTNDDLVEVNVCTSAAGAMLSLPVYAQDSGLFRRYGLDVRLSAVAGGSRAVAALTSDSVQLCLMAGVPVANAVMAGANLVVVGSLADTYTYRFIVSRAVRTPADLKGKAVAVSAPGTASATAMSLALESMGLQPGQDVSLLAIGDYRQRMAAMEAGYVVGTLLDYPDVELAGAKSVRTLLDMAPLNLPTLHIAIVTHRRFLIEHRPIVLRFVQAISHAMVAVKRDRQGSVTALSKFTGLDLNEHAAALEKTHEAVFLGRLKATPAVSADGVRAVLAEAAKSHPDAAEVRPEAFADLTVVEELARSGFFETLER